MGVFKMERFLAKDLVQTFRFDGSPGFAIAKEFGLVEGSVELKNETSYGSVKSYEVFAFQTSEDKKKVHVGNLHYRAPLWPGGPSVPF